MRLLACRHWRSSSRSTHLLILPSVCDLQISRSSDASSGTAMEQQLSGQILNMQSCRQTTLCIRVLLKRLGCKSAVQDAWIWGGQDFLLL
jgi:hypothetical protein